MLKTHQYKAALTWTGNKGAGTSDYKAYDRNYVIAIQHKAEIFGSADPQFRGDITRHNPEELLLASLSSCHMLWFLHLCSSAGIIITAYQDNATGMMQENEDGSGHFTEVILQPSVTIKGEIITDKMNQLHKEANKKCFIASSCNFPVKHIPIYSLI